MTAAVSTSKPAPALPVAADLAARLVAHTGAGFQNATIDDYALPFLHVLQKMSHEVDASDAKYVKGAVPGMFMNSVTQELFDGAQGIEVIPVDFQKVFNVWVPRTAGGGFKGSGTSREEAGAKVEELRKLGVDKPLEIIDTANHFLLMREPLTDKLSALVLSCTSTKMKASRVWMSLMARVTIGEKPAPSFAKRYVLKTIAQTNEKGTFSNIKAEVVDGPGGWVTAEELDAAETFFKQIKAGKRGADFSVADEPSDLVDGAPAF